MNMRPKESEVLFRQRPEQWAFHILSPFEAIGGLVSYLPMGKAKRLPGVTGVGSSFVSDEDLMKTACLTSKSKGCGRSGGSLAARAAGLGGECKAALWPQAIAVR